MWNCGVKQTQVAVCFMNDLNDQIFTLENVWRNTNFLKFLYKLIWLFIISKIINSACDKSSLTN